MALREFLRGGKTIATVLQVLGVRIRKNCSNSCENCSGQICGSYQDAAPGLKKVGIVKDTHVLITLQYLGASPGVSVSVEAKSQSLAVLMTCRASRAWLEDDWATGSPTLDSCDCRRGGGTMPDGEC